MLQAASLFNQLLQHFPRMEFAALVKKHQAERAAKLDLNTRRSEVVDLLRLPNSEKA